jgi:hypothetical protein
MFCDDCGTPTDAAANFCTGCGARLGPHADLTTRHHPIVELGDHGTPEERLARRALPILVVQRGPNRGAQYTLTPGTTTVGRDGSATIFLDDITVSRRHATLESDGSGCVVADAGSLNGTYLNGERIDRPHRLAHGDQLQIGRFRIAYTEPAAPAAQAPGGVGHPAAPRPRE